MGTIQTEASKVGYGVKSIFENVKTTSTSAFSSIIGKVSAGAAGILNGDVVGINEAEIPNMQNAIREYVTGLETHLAGVKADADTSNAFKGDYAAAVTTFVNSVCDACAAITSNLLEFNAKLDEVMAKYKEKDADVASTLTTQAGEIDSSYTKFTE